MSDTPKRRRKPDMPKHYSGDLSRPFWKRVNALPELDQHAAYALGVALQNLEEQVLKNLHDAERHPAGDR